MLQHQLDDLAQREARGLLAQHIQLCDEAADVGASLARDSAHCVIERAADRARRVLQLLHAARADAARREIHHAHETGVVVRVLQQAQIGQRVLDFGALEKAQAAIDAVGHGRIEKCRFNHPALRIATVEHGDFLARQALAHELAHLIDHPRGFGEIAGGFVYAYRLARALRGAKVLAQARLVVADELIRRVEDVASASVIFFQLDLVLDLELAHEVGHVAHSRAAKGVDALVVVTHRQHTAQRPGQHLDPGVLQLVRVLKLVDQDVTKAPLVVLAYRVVVTQELIAAQHQLAEINHAFALALVFVQLVDLDLAARFVVARFDHVGAQAVFLASCNEPLCLLGGKALVVDVVGLHQPLDGAQLVLRVQDLEALRQVGQLVVRTQQAVAQAVEGADPHAAHIDGQHGRQPHEHLLGGLVGERDGEDATRGDLPGLQQPGDTRSEHPGLARARARQNQCVFPRQRDGGELLGVEVL